MLLFPSFIWASLASLNPVYSAHLQHDWNEEATPFSLQENKKPTHHQLGWQILLALQLHPLAQQALALSEHPQSEFHVLLK